MGTNPLTSAEGLGWGGLEVVGKSIIISASEVFLTGGGGRGGGMLPLIEGGRGGG